VYPKGIKKNNSLSIYLEVMQINEICMRWNRDVKFNLLVLNQLNNNRTIHCFLVLIKHVHEIVSHIIFICIHSLTCLGLPAATDIQFKPSLMSWGFESFMSLAELHDSNNGFIVNDVCIVGVEVYVCKSIYEKPLNQTEHMELEVPKPNPDADAELVYSAFGRVICFLKTRKVKDINEQACKELQLLWNELKKFKFDLTWLEPHVQSALGMKSFVEKAIQVEKLKTELVAAEVNLDTERNLLIAKGLKEVDLDSELGCGSWRP
jgi:hypothetical protein